MVLLRPSSLLCAATAAAFISCLPQAAYAQTAATLPPAEPTSQWWLTPGGVSYHFSNQDEFNQVHPGIGVEYHFKPDLAAMGGTFKNSNCEWSQYAGVNWTPLSLSSITGKSSTTSLWNAIHFGLTAQVTNHYRQSGKNGGPFVFAAPVIAIDGERFGANIYIIPSIGNVTGAIALQFKFKLG